MNYPGVNAAFRLRGVVGDAAENHGALCGLLCARGFVSRDEWLAVLDDAAAAPDAPPPADERGGAIPSLSAGDAVLQILYQETVGQLHDGEFGFRLLLPDDEQPLTVRAAALADWCSGFLYGLGAAAIGEAAAPADEVREIIRDLAEISRTYHEDEEAETDEAAYLELTEYVRMGVTLIFEELEAARNTLAENELLH